MNEFFEVHDDFLPQEHFKQLHDLDVDLLDGVALMTDTDQTGLEAISYYQNIYFSSN